MMLKNVVSFISQQPYQANTDSKRATRIYAVISLSNTQKPRFFKGFAKPLKKLLERMTATFSERVCRLELIGMTSF